MSTELVNVAVPRQHLSRVYGLIAQLEGKVVVVETPPEVDDSPSPSLATDEWSPALIRKMVDQSEKPMRAVLKTLASRPGEWLPGQDLTDAMGGAQDQTKLAGTLGAFGRRCKSRYRLETKPYDRRYEHGVGKVYRMSKEVAQQVLQALKNGH